MRGVRNANAPTGVVRLVWDIECGRLTEPEAVDFDASP
jgi:hypothetical protein